MKPIMVGGCSQETTPRVKRPFEGDRNGLDRSRRHPSPSTIVSRLDPPRRPEIRRRDRDCRRGEGSVRPGAGRYEQPFWSELNLTGPEGPEIKLSVGNEYRGKGKGPTHGPWAENPSGWFCTGYGPFRRLYGASPEARESCRGRQERPLRDHVQRRCHPR